jgi:UDP:flavonoid glycosyltransferase YjiC (YdhE family)
MSTTTKDPRYRRRAQEVSTALAAEDGTGTAVKLIQKLLDSSVTKAH